MDDNIDWLHATNHLLTRLGGVIDIFVFDALRIMFLCCSSFALCPFIFPMCDVCVTYYKMHTVHLIFPGEVVEESFVPQSQIDMYIF